MCLRLLFDTKMFNRSLFLDRSEDAASKWSKACCHSKLPSLEFSGDKLIGNGNSFRLYATEQAITVPSTDRTFHSYNSKIFPATIG